ncbi:MAG: HAMP domain-containing histidine kinase [Actinomycetia bacterium]|nr:HAMP domain-containing histidine kinase [Actinomycetes bacterium]
MTTDRVGDGRASTRHFADGAHADPLGAELRAGIDAATAVYQAALREMPVAVIRLAPDFQFLGATTPAARLFGHPEGWEPPSMDDGGLLAMVHPDDVDTATEALARIVGGDGVEPWHPVRDAVEIRFRQASGDYLWIEVRGVNLFEDPAVGGILLSVTDASERVALQEAVSEAIDARGKLFRTIAHELRAPVTAILGSLDLLDAALREAAVEGPAARSALQARSAAERIRRLVADITDSARLSAGDFALSLEYFDLEPVVSEEAAAIRAEAAQRSVSVSRQVDAGPAILGDEVRIRQVVANLVSNAVKYNVEGGAVLVTAKPEGDWWVVSVIDTGIGMGDEDRERLFEEFYRTTTATEHAIGTGLGLAVSRGLVEAHGGTIGVESTPGKGSVFTARFPINGPESAAVQRD